MDRGEFDLFVAESTNGLLRTAYLIVWDLHEAEDLVRETLFKVASRCPKVRRIDHPVAYARRIRPPEILWRDLGAPVRCPLRCNHPVA